MLAEISVPALATSKPTSAPPVRSLIPPPTFPLPVSLPALLAATKCTQAGSSVVVRSASTGSSLPYGLWGLRPTFRVPTRKSTVLLPVISVARSLVTGFQALWRVYGPRLPDKHRLVWHRERPHRLFVGEWGRADLCDRRTGLRRGQDKRNEHSQLDSGNKPSVLCYSSLRSFSD